MGKLTPSSEWRPDHPYELAPIDPVLGGPPIFDGTDEVISGFANAHGQHLADRTDHLKDWIDAIANGDECADTEVGTPAIPVAPGIKPGALGGNLIKNGTLPGMYRNSAHSGPWTTTLNEEWRSEIASLSGTILTVDGSVTPIIYSFADGYDANGHPVDYAAAFTGTDVIDFTGYAQGNYAVIAKYNVGTGAVTHEILVNDPGGIGSKWISSRIEPTPVHNLIWIDPYAWKVKIADNTPAWVDDVALVIGRLEVTAGQPVFHPCDYQHRWNDQDNLPAGAIMLWGYFQGTAVPPGWLHCNGASVSIYTYWRLFEAIGRTNGNGNNHPHTMNLPNIAALGGNHHYMIKF